MKIFLCLSEFVSVHFLGSPYECSNIVEGKCPHPNWQIEDHHQPAEETHDRRHIDRKHYFDFDVGFDYLAIRIFCRYLFSIIYEKVVIDTNLTRLCCDR